jgi:hypothetical protein
VRTARRQFIISSRYHHASSHSKVESRRRVSISDHSISATIGSSNHGHIMRLMLVALSLSSANDCNTTISPPLLTRTQPITRTEHDHLLLSPSRVLSSYSLTTITSPTYEYIPIPIPGHLHQTNLSPPYPFPFRHPFSELAIIGVNGGKRVNRTSPVT